MGLVSFIIRGNKKIHHCEVHGGGLFLYDYYKITIKKYIMYLILAYYMIKYVKRGDGYG